MQGVTDPDGSATVLTKLDINAEYPLEAASLVSSAVLLGSGHRPIFN